MSLVFLGDKDRFVFVSLTFRFILLGKNKLFLSISTYFILFLESFLRKQLYSRRKERLYFLMSYFFVFPNFSQFANVRINSINSRKNDLCVLSSLLRACLFWP